MRHAACNSSYQTYITLMELPSEIGVMVLPNAVLYPHTIMPLYIFEPRYRAMLADALNSHRYFSVALQRPDRVRETPSAVAGIGLIRAAVENNDGTSHLVVQGLSRIQLGKLLQSKPYRVHQALPVVSDPAQPAVADALMCKTRELVRHIFDDGLYPGGESLKKVPKDSTTASLNAQTTDTYRHFMRQMEKIEDPEVFTDAVAGALLPSPEERQVILEAVHVEDRLKQLVHFLLAVIKRARNTDAT